MIWKAATALLRRFLRRDMNNVKEMKNGPYRSRFCVFAALRLPLRASLQTPAAGLHNMFTAIRWSG